VNLETRDVFADMIQGRVSYRRALPPLSHHHYSKLHTHLYTIITPPLPSMPGSSSSTTSYPRYTTRSDIFADEILTPYPEFIVPSDEHFSSPFDTININIMSSLSSNLKNIFRRSSQPDVDAYAALEKRGDMDVEALARRSEDAASSSDADTLRGDGPAESVSTSRAFKVDARFISDAIIGLSDGLTVPFALTAGLSGLGDNKVVILGGFAELIAGAISMGLGVRSTSQPCS
jgi:hypothetical protein